MGAPEAGIRVGIESVRTMTELLQRARNADPSVGLYQAAELQFWWSSPRSTDTFEQLFWFDDQGRPEAAAVVYDFGSNRSIVFEAPTVVFAWMPDATPNWIAHMVDRALDHFKERGIGAVEVEVDRSDGAMGRFLADRGFEMKGDAIIEGWLDAEAIPSVSDLHDGYRLIRRSETPDRPHHLADENRPDRDERLLQTSLYRPDLDLFIVDGADNWVANGMFWHDPVTQVGVVEPMRTHDDHQQRGLARHILTTGVGLLAQAGAIQISINWEPDNPASARLYQDVGFEAHRHTEMWAGPTG